MQLYLSSCHWRPKCRLPRAFPPRLLVEERAVLRITRKKALVTAAVAAASAMSTRGALGTAYTWTGADAATNTNWSNGNNWSPVGPPAATADTLLFSDTGLGTNTVDAGLT